MTKKVASKMDYETLKNNSYSARVLSAKLGNIVLQIKDNQAFIYLLENVTESQITMLSKIINPRNINFSVFHDSQMIANISHYKILALLYNIKNDIYKNNRKKLDYNDVNPK